MLNGNSIFLQEAEEGDLVNTIESHNGEGEKEMEDSSHHPTSSIMTVLRPDSPLVGATDNSREEEEGIQEVEQAEGGIVESPWQSGLGERLDDGSVTSLASEETVSWRISVRLSDDESVTSLASEETVKWQHLKCVECIRSWRWNEVHQCSLTLAPHLPYVILYCVMWRSLGCRRVL